MKNFVNYRNILAVALPLVVVTAFGINPFVKTVSAYYGTSMVPASVNGIPVTVQSGTESFSGATYSAGYRIYAPNNQDVTFQIQTQTNRCDTPYGDPNSPYKACADNVAYDYKTISLNASNNYSENVTLSVTQRDNKPCGSMQTDINFPEGGSWKFILGSLHHTGRAMSECTIPSPSINPSPSTSPSNIQCPVGKIAKVENSTIICVAQNQQQTQTQTQNNNQNQTVNQNVNANGGSSSSSSSSSSSVNLTINNPTPSPTATPTAIVVSTTTYTAQPQVVAQVKGDVKELPKTGLPLAALALGGLMPAGFGIKRFGKKSSGEVSPNSIWNEKQLNS